MTYCVGLRTDRGIFIAADSIFSSALPPLQDATKGTKTVFGEELGDVGPYPFKYVSEDGLKLTVGQDSVTGFAGHEGIATALINAYQQFRTSGSAARRAVRNALASVTPSEDDADVLFAFYENGKPCLLHVNTASSSCCDVERLIQLGSDLPEGQHRWTSQIVENYLKLLDQLGQHPLHTERIFSQLIAVLQSYGATEYLLQYGVGGAFVGAWITPSGARWQGDHLYVMHGETPAMEDPSCATIVRNDVLCLVNNQTGATKSITRIRQNESTSEAKNRSEAASESAVDFWDRATFDYFVSINTHKHIVTVVEMCKRQHHKILSLHAPAIERRLGILWSDAFLQFVNSIEGVDTHDPELMSIKFLPFYEISKEEEDEREQISWERFVDLTD